MTRCWGFLIKCEFVSRGHHFCNSEASDVKSWWFTFLSRFCTCVKYGSFPSFARIEYILKHSVAECCNWGAQLISPPQWVFWGHLGISSGQLMWEHLYRNLIMSSQRSRVIQLYKNLLHLGREYPQGYDYFRSKCHNAFTKNKDIKGEPQVWPPNKENVYKNKNVAFL